MSRDDFRLLVARLEAEARARPRAYLLRVSALAALGYGYVFAVLGGVLAALAGLFWVGAHTRSGHGAIGQLGLALLAFGWVIVRSAWVRLPPPEGLRLEPRQAPRLFEEIERLRSALRAPKLHAVVISGDFNASITQVPRLGVLGWPSNWLALGLPLMLATSPEEFRAILAHELGHLSREHGRASAWLYRVRQTWSRLAEALAQDRRVGAFVFRRFFGWFVPRFDAYTFVLARQQEYEADRRSVEASDASRAADALVRGRLAARWLDEEYWPGVYAAAQKHAEPHGEPFAALEAALATPCDPARARGWLDEALGLDTEVHDTHPSLADRLAALGETPRVPAAIASNAARPLLGATLEPLAQALDAQWRHAVHGWWAERNAELTRASERLASLEQRGAARSRDESVERAHLLGLLRGEAEALPLWNALLAEASAPAAAEFNVGRAELARDDAAGRARLERAARAERYDLELPVCEALHGYFLRAGDRAQARAMRERAERFGEILQQSHAERAVLRPDEAFAPHDVPAEALARLCELLRAEPYVRAAWLLRREPEHFPERPCYALLLERRVPWWKLELDTATAVHVLITRVAEKLDLPGDGIVAIAPRRGAQRKRVDAIANARIYPAS